MNSIERIYEILKEHSGNFEGKYYIPEKWNYSGFTGYAASKERPGEIRVDPYEFYKWNIKKYFLGHKPEKSMASLSQSVIYSMMPRFCTAWPHGEDGKIQSGTFLKCMLLLPPLKQLGVNLIYLLPVFQYSSKYKKGSLGSIYSIRNIYMLDEGLHDPILDGADVSLEFKAFVEACHMLGMRVMLDFVFRTAARDCDLIYGHPDWFYWIDAQKESKFCLPAFKLALKKAELTPKTLKRLYEAALSSGYFDFFTQSPEKFDRVKWRHLCNDRRHGKDAFPEIVNGIGVTTAPGFSDIVNDRQPPWTDITYLRLYFDQDARAKPYIKPGQPPYIMQDGASLNIFHGQYKNDGLWDYIIRVIPFYEEKYGIDGARIDMAHALPHELCSGIITAARKVNPNFILWSEELNPKNGRQAALGGFDFISGPTYFNYKKFRQADFNDSLIGKTLLASPLPMISSLETPDTPRAAQNCKDRRYLKMMTVLSCFVPNSIPFINNGQVLMERQPMNLGLDGSAKGRYVLPKSDQMYGKLAFFDSSFLHWLQGSSIIKDALKDAVSLRKQFSSLVCSKSAFVPQATFPDNRSATILCYQGNASSVFCIANRGKKGLTFPLCDVLPKSVYFNGRNADVVYDGDGRCTRHVETSSPLLLGAGEIMIGTASR
ncbi:MAG TPA: alpha amylase [Ruminococcaceae bacterium]|jgi:glycosidase|nr:alpha amylase [Oscillospiraceae bacterium]